MSIRYPGGSGASSPLPAAPAKKPRRPRRKTEEGGNSQYRVSPPAKDSPLRVQAAVYRAQGWKADYIKFPCNCRNWTDKAANTLIIWRGMEHRQWCVCQVEQMIRRINKWNVV